MIGIDLSERLLAVARELHGDLEIEWRQGSAQRLQMEDDSIDIVVLHTLVSHVPDTVAVLREARRVLKPGGSLVVFDADYASTIYGYPDFLKGREYDHRLLGAVASNIDVCRQMPRYLREAGFSLETHRGYVISEAGEGDFWLSSVKGFAKLIPSLGILPKDEGEEWVRSMLDSHERGAFFASGNYYTFIAKPGAE
ncbi:MAG: SAM-dependent methyltransferase [Pseudoalteromonas tetraodonis]